MVCNDEYTTHVLPISCVLSTHIFQAWKTFPTPLILFKVHVICHEKLLWKAFKTFIFRIRLEMEKLLWCCKCIVEDETKTKKKKMKLHERCRDVLKNFNERENVLTNMLSFQFFTQQAFKTPRSGGDWKSLRKLQSRNKSFVFYAVTLSRRTTHFSKAKWKFSSGSRNKPTQHHNSC